MGPIQIFHWSEPNGNNDRPFGECGFVCYRLEEKKYSAINLSAAMNCFASSRSNLANINHSCLFSCLFEPPKNSHRSWAKSDRRCEWLCSRLLVDLFPLRIATCVARIELLMRSHSTIHVANRSITDFIWMLLLVMTSLPLTVATTDAGEAVAWRGVVEHGQGI